MLSDRDARWASRCPHSCTSTSNRRRPTVVRPRPLGGRKRRRCRPHVGPLLHLDLIAARPDVAIHQAGRHGLAGFIGVASDQAVGHSLAQVCALERDRRKIGSQDGTVSPVRASWPAGARWSRRVKTVATVEEGETGPTFRTACPPYLAGGLNA